MTSPRDPKKRLKNFLLQKKRRFHSLESSTSQIARELKEDLFLLARKPNINNTVKISKHLFNGATWIGKNYWHLMRPHEPHLFEKVEYLKSDFAQYILSQVKNKKAISYKKASYAEIFKTIFYDYEISHLDSSYKLVSTMPQIETSVLLISGVFNEMFSTPAFERGAIYLKEKYNIGYEFCPTSGVKSSPENSKMIKEHLDSLMGKKKKIWVFAFSKGGIDFLHFLKDYPQRNEICGLSTVASPILGTENVNHRLLRFLNKIHDYSENSLYQYLDKHFDLFFKELQKSLSSEFRENWFQENYSFLPRNMFYSALGLKSDWYDSHIWMILTKLFFQSDSINDGVVDVEKALFPDYFQGINLGILKGHHLIGTRSSDYIQEALIEGHITFLNYMGFL